jgi:heptosyltransferase II
MHILIIKHGALGDVVRTSYFARPLKEKWGERLRLSWLTAAAAIPLLRFNPAVDDIWTSFDDARPFHFDHVFSLDDELPVLAAVSSLHCRNITGAYLDGEGKPAYTADAAEWFDMGLLSRFGKAQADELKKRNQRGHAEIYEKIFDVRRTAPEFFGDPRLVAWAREWVGARRPAIGINPFAGGRWPAKELPKEELRKLVHCLLQGKSPYGPDCQVILLGAGADFERNSLLAGEFSEGRVRVAGTDDSVLRLAAIIKQLNCLVTSDSLAMHLAISQQVHAVAFFAPTSAQEIDGFGLIGKVVSTADDYCSYKRDASNDSITCRRILEAMARCAAPRRYLRT